MFKLLVATEFKANQKIVLLFVSVNLVLFLLQFMNGSKTESLVVLSMVSYWVFLIVYAAIANEDKRTRLYVQLPVSKHDIYWANMFFCLIWLPILVALWIAYGLLLEGSIAEVELGELFAFAFGMLIFTLLVSIGIDLYTFKPAYLGWLYVIMIVAGILLLAYFDTSIGLIRNEEGILFFPIALLGNTSLEILVSGVISVVLIAVDYLVFRYGDSYLN